MILTAIVSGLGNQLFQYAAGYALAARHGVPLRLDLRFFQDQTLRRYELGRFDISARPITPADRFRLRLSTDNPPRGPPRGPLRRAARRLPVRRLTLLRETADGAAPSLLTAPDYAALSGYWQDERNFRDAAAGLRRELTFRDAPDPENAAMLDRIRGAANPVCVHVRRGDYLTGTEVLTACPPQYYVDALAWLGRRVPDAHHFVFSDDPDWVRAHLPVPPTAATFVRHNTGVNDAEDLRLMSACRHFIIANSTFSWWGAWLATGTGKLVVAPRRWYAVPHPNEGRIVPDAWVRL